MVHIELLALQTPDLILKVYFCPNLKMMLGASKVQGLR